LYGATSPLTLWQQTILPRLSDAAGQHCPLQHTTLGGQHVLLTAPLTVFSQITGALPDGQALQVPVAGFVHECPAGQHTFPHICSDGQQVLPTQPALSGQQTLLQQLLNGGQQPPPQMCDGAAQQVPSGAHAPSAQHTPLQIGLPGGQHTLPG
jgi:hypothetical protein